MPSETSGSAYERPAADVQIYGLTLVQLLDRARALLARMDLRLVSDGELELRYNDMRQIISRFRKERRRRGQKVRSR